MKTLFLMLLLIPSLMPCPDGGTGSMEVQLAAAATQADEDSHTDFCGMCPCACCGHGALTTFGPQVANPHSNTTLDIVQSPPSDNGAQFLPWRPPTVL